MQTSACLTGMVSLVVYRAERNPAAALPAVTRHITPMLALTSARKSAASIVGTPSSTGKASTVMVGSKAIWQQEYASAMQSLLSQISLWSARARGQTALV